MAEAMANHYGKDVLEASSAGVAPSLNTSADTRATLLERNIDLGDHLPRKFRELDPKDYDIIVNMSGQPLSVPADGPVVENWTVKDPYRGTPDDYRRACGDIEMLVMRLILRIRTGKFDSQPADSRQ